jgi:RimJ/RimL family protein N-acetyltransferase
MASFSDLSLPTSRLLLRPLKPSDADALFAIFSDPQVMRYWSSAPWESVEFSKAYIERDQQAMAEGRHVRLAITARNDSAFLGTCTLFDHVTQCRRAEVGFGLSPSAWGKGYATEAVGELLAFGFTTMELNRVEADIDPRNSASARCLQRLGFTKEGHLRERWIVAGEVSDSALYGLLRAEWNAGATGRERDA